jgi:hypothetical protein
MKISKKAIQLIDKGLTAKTVSKLTESQIDTLHKKLIYEQINVSKSDTATISKLKSEKKPFQMYEKELEEEEEVTIDPNKDTETQDPHQIGPSSDDGFGTESDDGMGMFEGKQKPNPWSICHSQVGPKKSRKWERCVREVKKQLAEGKNPVSLFLETQIMNIVERNLQPRITKKDLVKYLSESDNFATKHLQSWGKSKPSKVKSEVGEQSPATAPSKPKTSPTTKPGKPGTKPQRPPSPFKNPNPGEKESPKAKKVSPEKAKDEVIDVIMQLLQK